MLAFMAESRGEAPMAADEGTELPATKRETESLASAEQLMEEVCQRISIAWPAYPGCAADDLTSRTAVYGPVRTVV